MTKQLFSFFALLVLASACSSEVRLSARGETCRFRNECEAGLACVNAVCIDNEYEVAATARYCDRLECQNQQDCCERNPNADCDRLACTEGLCRTTCTDDPDCGNGNFCITSRCVDCRDDNDCVGDSVCRTGACVDPCESRTDCPFLNDCRNGDCVYVGCTDDRECKAFLDDARAVCGAPDDAMVRGCEVPCQNDEECQDIGGFVAQNPRNGQTNSSNQNDYDFFECLSGRCQYVGCATDEECRIFLNLGPNQNDQAVCRD